MKTVDVIAAVLVVIGALNWGLVGLFELDLVSGIFGEGALLSRLVYSVVGLAGFFQAIQWKAIQRRWQDNPAMA